MASAQEYPSIIKCYTAALLETASEENVADKIAKDLQEMSGFYSQSKDLDKVVRHKSISVVEQAAVIEKIAEKARFQELTKRFLSVLASRRRLALLPAIAESYERLLAESRGQLTAEVRVFAPVSEKVQDSLKEILEAKLNKQLKLCFVTDPSIKGGVVVRVGSWMIDYSLRSRLDSMRMLAKHVVAGV